MDQSLKMAQITYHALDEKKAENIKILKVGEISVIADYFIIANGTNASQVNAMVDSVEDNLAKEGFFVKRIEGVRNSNWVLMDYGDIVVHIFSKEDRLFYDLERIWRDGREISIEEMTE